jgi:hypothetical protein
MINLVTCNIFWSYSSTCNIFRSCYCLFFGLIPVFQCSTSFGLITVLIFGPKTVLRFYPREHAACGSTFCFLLLVLLLWWMLYSIIANFVMVARQVVYCEFRHGCKSGSCVFTLH